MKRIKLLLACMLLMLASLLVACGTPDSGKMAETLPQVGVVNSLDGN